MEKCIRCKKTDKKGQSVEYYNNIGIWLPKFQSDVEISLNSEELKNLCDDCSKVINNFFSAYYNCRTAAREFGTVGGYRGHWEYDTKNQTIKFWENDKEWNFELEKQSFPEIWKAVYRL